LAKAPGCSWRSGRAGSSGASRQAAPDDASDVAVVSREAGGSVEDMAVTITWLVVDLPL